MDRYIVPYLAANNILKLMSPIVVVVLCRIPVMLIKQNDSIVLLRMMIMTTTIQQNKTLWEIPWYTSPFSCLRAVHQLLCLMGRLGLCIRTLRSTDNTTDVL